MLYVGPMYEELPRESLEAFFFRNVCSLSRFFRTVEGDFLLHVPNGLVGPGGTPEILTVRVPNWSPFLVSRNSLAWSPLPAHSRNVSNRRFMVSPSILSRHSLSRLMVMMQTCCMGKGHTSIYHILFCSFHCIMLKL